MIFWYNRCYLLIVWIITLILKEFINNNFDNFFKTITFSAWTRNQKDISSTMIILTILEIFLKFASNLIQQTALFHDDYPHSTKAGKSRDILSVNAFLEEIWGNDEIRFSTGGWRCVSCTTRSQLQLEPVIPSWLSISQASSFESSRKLLSGHAAGPFSFD